MTRDDSPPFTLHSGAKLIKVGHKETILIMSQDLQGPTLILSFRHPITFKNNKGHFAIKRKKIIHLIFSFIFLNIYIYAIQILIQSAQLFIASCLSRWEMPHHLATVGLTTPFSSN